MTFLKISQNYTLNFITLPAFWHVPPSFNSWIRATSFQVFSSSITTKFTLYRASNNMKIWSSQPTSLKTHHESTQIFRLQTKLLQWVHKKALLPLLSLFCPYLSHAILLATPKLCTLTILFFPPHKPLLYLEWLLILIYNTIQSIRCTQSMPLILIAAQWVYLHHSTYYIAL